jgi:hypothetical protein
MGVVLVVVLPLADDHTGLRQHALRPHPEVAGLVSDRVLSSEAGLTVAEHTLAPTTP